jgi:ribosomal protein S18 acetylase RimI-like enzyme
MAQRIEVIPRRESDWERLRDLRLEMLADTPKAYVETLAAAQAYDEEDWRFRARRSSEPGSFGVVAVDRGLDLFVGTMSAFTEPESGRAFLVAVYVAPGYRGHASAAADLMLDQVEAWAAAQGQERLTLHVHEDNARAIAFYLKRGYDFTGVEVPYELDATERELEMSREL